MATAGKMFGELRDKYIQAAQSPSYFQMESNQGNQSDIEPNGESE